MSERSADYFAAHARFAKRQAATRQRLRVQNGQLTATESQEQQALIQRAQVERHTVNGCIIHDYLVAIPNGADIVSHWDDQRGEYVSPNRERLLREGMAPGFPDLVLFHAASGLHGLAIEMKSATGRLGDKQIEWRDKLIKAGYGWRLCRSADEAWAVSVQYVNGEFRQ